MSEEKGVISLKIDTKNLKTEEDEVETIRVVRAILRTFREGKIRQGPDQTLYVPAQGEIPPSEALIDEAPVTGKNGTLPDKEGGLTDPRSKVVVFPSVAMRGEVPVRALSKPLFISRNDVMEETSPI